MTVVVQADAQPAAAPSSVGAGARRGWVYLVGAGPGDPALLTVRAEQLLASATVVMHDAQVSAAVVERALPGARVIVLSARPGGTAAQQHIAEAAELLGLAAQQEAVVWLLAGDPFLYGGLSEPLRLLRAAGVPYEVTAGVASTLSLGAYAGVALADGQTAGSVTLVAAVGRDGGVFEWGKLRGLGGTLCISLPPSQPPAPSLPQHSAAGSVSLDRICRGLMIDAGLSGETPAALVQRVGRPSQWLVEGSLAALPALAAAADMGVASILVLGEPVAARAPLSWFDKQPLFGKRVLVTRPQHQVGAAAELLRRCGAEPVAFPTIAIEPPPDPARVEQAIANMDDYDLVVFTSVNGVAFFFKVLAQADEDARVFGGCRIAAIGPATAAALKPHGLRADIVAKTFVAEGLVEEILAQVPLPCRVLIPRALVARELLPEALRAAGMRVDVVPVYQTVTATPERGAQLREVLRDIDMVMLTSSSTAEQLFGLLGESPRDVLSGCALASIGPITTATVERLGATVAVTATVSTVPGLIDAMVSHAAIGG